MAESDDQIELIRRAPTPDGEEDAEFLRSCKDDMSHTWPDFVSEVLSMLPFGWSWHEVVYKQRQGFTGEPSTRSKFNDNNIGWRKMPIRDELWEGIDAILASLVEKQDDDDDEDADVSDIDDDDEDADVSDIDDDDIDNIPYDLMEIEDSDELAARMHHDPEVDDGETVSANTFGKYEGVPNIITGPLTIALNETTGNNTYFVDYEGEMIPVWPDTIERSL